MTGNLTCRLFEGEDLESIERHYVSPIGRRLDRALWEWQYKKNPASRGDTPGFVCVDSVTEEFVGCIFSTPWLYRVGADVYHCTIGSDAFVRPEYRGRGVYNAMAEYMLREGVKHLGSVRVLFYNHATKDARTSASLLMETSVSVKIRNVDKVVETMLGGDPKGVIASTLLKLQRKKKPRARQVEVQEGSLEGFHCYYDEWAGEQTAIHTPRTREYLRWRFQDRPRTASRFYSVTDGEKNIGYFVATVDDGIWSNPLKTLAVSDYFIKGNDPDVFAGAVSAILEEDGDVDLIVARAFTTPELESRLRQMGFLDNKHFPLNQFMKPGGLGIRLYDERLRDLIKTPWYLTQADCF
jgi:GNAT superfamily N-acetyltransferase